MILKASIPKIQIEVDSGGEFKGVVARWFEDQNIRVRVAEPNRHRQQGLVELKNKVIGAVLLQLQAIEELKTNKPNTKWVKVLPTVIKFINEDLPPPITTQKSDLPYSNKYNENLLSIGTEVRTALNHPIEINSGKKLHGNFRESDIRFSKTKHKITDVILKPSFPPMYLIDGRKTAITRNEILI